MPSFMQVLQQIPDAINFNKRIKMEPKYEYAGKKELKNYEGKSEILSAVKFGKNDPFSKSDIQTKQLDSNFQLKGFLKANLKNYVFVSLDF